MALKALLQADSIDWNRRRIEVSPSARLSSRRDNGTLRDLDVLTPTTDKEQAQLLNQEMKQCLAGDMVTSAFRVRPYEENKIGLFDFVGDRYLQETPGGNQKLFWRLSGIETEIPVQSLEPWQVVWQGQNLFNTIGPVAHLGAYINRSITGVCPKDTEKVVALKRIVMPGGRMKDIPVDYREQYFAFLEQAGKVARARRRLS